MSFSSPRPSVLFSLLFALVTPVVLTAQTTINVNNTPLQTNIKRFGINLGNQNFYDSGQMLKNLIFTNPSFEGEIYHSTVRCGSGTANSCTDENIYSGWPVSFWRNASYEMISGASVGRSGLICSFSGSYYPSPGVFTFCDSGTAPAPGDYMVVKINMPTDVGWPGGDWRTIVGNGSLTAETYDLPPGTTGKQSALLTAPTASDSIALNTFFDTELGKTFIQLNGSYQLTFKAKGVAGSQSLAIQMTRADANLTYINQTIALTNNWAPYTINFNASENGSAIGRVEISFTTVGADTVELDDLSLVKTNTDPTNTTVFRDEVVNTLQALHPGVMRLWDDQLGESLDNLLTDPQGRQRSGYTPYGGFDSTDVNFQTQSVEFGLTDFLQLCQKVGADPWIVVPSTFSTSEAYNLIDYLAGPSSTTYGAKRAAAGQAQPWTSVFKQIHLEFGNEEWNGGTFKGGSIEYGDSYGGRATAIFTAMKGNSSYSAPSFDLIVNGQSAAPYRNQNIQSFTKNNDSFAIAPYLMYNITAYDTVDHLFGTTFAEAEAYVTPNASAEGVDNGYITAEQQLVGKPIVTSEMNLGPSGGTISQSALNTYSSSIGGGIAVLDAMFQQLRAGVLTQNLFELPGYVSTTSTNPANTMYLWGAVVDMGVTNRTRPQYLALQLANNAIGSATQMLQTVHTGTDPTDNQYNFGLNSVTLPVFHYLQSFAFTGNGSNSLVVFNVNPDFAEQVNFAGAYAPTGTVVMQQLTSGNITDNNELANIVGTTSTTLSNFNPSANMTLPPFSMTVFTWGGTVQSAPVISNVIATSVTSNSATITWTTDQASSSQVKYGTTTSYGSLSSVNNTLTTSHSVLLSGLTPGTTYDFAAISANGSSQSTTSANAAFTTLSAAPVITNVSTSAITSTSATITWTTDQASSSQVKYGTTTSYGTSSTLNGTLSTTHSVTLTSLTAGTTYDFAVVSVNGASQSTTSANFTFATNTVAPQITSVAASGITATSATITWTTDQGATSQVSYGTTTAYGTLTTVNSVLSVTHTVTLTSLTPGTTYNYAAISANSSSQSTTSGNFTFTTTSVAPQITNVTATAITATSATITWTTDQPASTRVSYGTTTSYGTLSTLNATLSTSHSVTLTNLTAGTTYNYAAISVNAAAQSTTSGNFIFATTAAGAPQITNVTASGITTTSATITWTTDQAASSQVAYGTTTAYGTLSTPNSTLLTSHSVTLTSLTAGTTYNFAVISANNASQSTTSGNFTFTTTTVAPQITSVTATAITSTSATITWTTDQAASSRVSYGTTTSYGTLTTLNPTLSTSHSVTLTNLTAGTTYNYAAISANSASQSTTSGNFTFTTTAAGSGPGPVITNEAAWPVGDNTATILWTTDQNATGQVNYGTTTAYGSQTPLVSSLGLYHAIPLAGLNAGTTYHFSVVSTNAANGTTVSPDFSFTTSGMAGSPAPVISAVASSGITAASATITWTTDQAATSQVSYGTTTAYGTLSTLNTTLVTSHSVVLTGLTQGTTYNYAVISANGSSTISGNFTFTTTTVAASGPVITNEAAYPVGDNTATILWVTDQNATGQVKYGTTTAYGSQTTAVTSLGLYHAIPLTGLSSGTTYHFAVVSTNASNMTTTSPDFSFTTTGTVTAPAPVISAVASSGITSTAATITWTTDQASNSAVSYGTTTSYGSLSPVNSNAVTAHSVTLTGLTPGTTYNYAVISANSANASTTSANFTFTTTALVASGPVITNVAAYPVGNNTATILWTTDQNATSQVNYGTTSSYGLQTPLVTSLGLYHLVQLSGLNSGTTYHYSVVSTNASNLTSTSPDISFTTTGVASNPAPIISAITVSAITSTSATINWTTDQLSTSQVSYGTTTAYGQLTTLSGTLVTAHSVTLSGLTAGTSYNFAAISANSSAVSTTSANFTFATTSVGGAPVISVVTAAGITSTSATITWTTDQPSSSQVTYGPTTAYGSSSTLDPTLVTSHSVTLTGLTASTSYNFKVASVNAASQAAASSNYTFATTAVAQGPAPFVSYVSFWGVTGSSVIISWSTDLQSTTQVAYGTTTAVTQLSTLQPALTTSHGVTLTNLNPGTTYYFVAQSTSSGGVTGHSTTYSFTTLAGPPTISGVTVATAANNTAVISWTTSAPTYSYVQYGTSTSYGRYSAQTSLTASPQCPLGFVPSGTIHYQLVSTDANGNQTVSPDAVFIEP